MLSKFQFLDVVIFVFVTVTHILFTDHNLGCTKMVLFIFYLRFPHQENNNNNNLVISKKIELLQRFPNYSMNLVICSQIQ